MYKKLLFFAVIMAIFYKLNDYLSIFYCQIIAIIIILALSNFLKLNLKKLYTDKYLKQNTIIFILLVIYIFVSQHVHVSTKCLAPVIGAPLFEELVFRGLLYKSLGKIKNKVLFFIVNSLIFMAAHISYYGDPSALLFVFCMGLVFCYLRNKYNNLIPGMYIHSITNLMTFI